MGTYQANTSFRENFENIQKQGVSRTEGEFIVEVRRQISVEKASKSLDRISVLEWIVRDWGGIRNISCDTLKNFDECLRQNPVACEHTKKRLASYSKCLAFFCPQEYYVFDSRVALALNALSFIFGTRNTVLFQQPSSRSKYTKAIARCLQVQSTEYLDYSAYCQIIRRLAGKTPDKPDETLSAQNIELELFMLGGLIRDEVRSTVGTHCRAEDLTVIIERLLK